MESKQFYGQLQNVKNIPDGSSDSDLSDNDEEAKISTQVLVANSDSYSYCSADGNSLLVIPASDEEVFTEDEDNIPLSVRIELSNNKKSNLPKKK